MERRRNERCPVCQGPVKWDDERLVCRNSLCSFNHEHVVCPRCSTKGNSEPSGYRDDEIDYICRDCQYQFSG